MSISSRSRCGDRVCSMQSSGRRVPSTKRFLAMTLVQQLVREGALPAVVDCTMEPRDGVIMRLQYASGAVRIVCGADIGVNSSGASALVSNKGYTKHFLLTS